MTAARKNHELPTVSAICGETIVELIYDAQAGKTALAVGRDGEVTITDRFETSHGSVLVPYAPSNNLIHHECVVLPSTPVDHGSKAQLIADIRGYLHRYVDLSPLFETIAAHYALLSWVYDAFGEIPYLRFKGDYGSGKTRALIALGSILYKGFFASGASTVSPIFHTLDSYRGTLILDEADLRYSGKTADLVKILNNGSVKGLPVLRTLQNRDKEFNPAAFTVYGPKIVAMRGTFRDEALESRFLDEPMGKRPLRSDIPIQLPPSLKADALDLRNRLLDYRMKHRFTVQTRPDYAIAGVEPRLNQTALSLLSIIDDAPTRGEIADMMQAKQAAIAFSRSRSLESRTLAAFQAALEHGRRSFVPLSEIVTVVNGDGGEGVVAPRDVGRVLRDAAVPLRKSHGIMVAEAPARAIAGIA